MINERRFSLDEAKYTIESEGFDFTQLQALFPFGFLGIREGEYAELVEMALDSLSTPDDQTLLMDLLDVQWHVYCEQLGFARDRSDDPESLVGLMHFAEARIQIDENVRCSRGLPSKRIGVPGYETRRQGVTLFDLLTANQTLSVELGAEIPGTELTRIRKRVRDHLAREIELTEVRYEDRPLLWGIPEDAVVFLVERKNDGWAVGAGEYIAVDGTSRKVLFHGRAGE
jgi:hypothetical protein